jgi:hypothetical protein
VSQAPHPPEARRRFGNLALVGLVGALALLSVWPMVDAAMGRAFGNPPPTLRELYAPGDQTVVFDHGDWSEVLAAVVDDQGYVAIGELVDRRAAVDAYLARVAGAPFDALGRDEKLALLLNAHAAIALRALIGAWPLASIQARDGGAAAESLGAEELHVVAGLRVTHRALANEWIRTSFRDPRTHFALNPGTLGGAPFRSEAYTGQQLDAQLEDQLQRVLGDGRFCDFRAEPGLLRLTQLFLWFASDFQQVAEDGTLLGYLRSADSRIDAFCEEQGTPSVTWLDYDWRVPDVRNRPR